MNNETDNRQSISKEELKKIFDSIEDIDVRCSFSDCNFKYNAFNEVDISSFEKRLFSFSNCIFDCELPYTTNIDYFVKCVFNERVYLHERKSNKNHYFTDCTFNNMVFIENQEDFFGDKLFSNCKFPKDIFPRNKDIDVPNINISNTTFKNSFGLVENEIHHILITDTIFKKPIFIDDKLKINFLSLHNCILEDGFLINNKYSNHMFSIKGLSLFGCNINGSFISRDCKIENLNLENSIFNNIAIFENTTFENDVNFEFTTFEKLASFKNVCFKKALNLEDSIFKEEANFLQMNGDLANRETARIIKNFFERENNIIEANRFYALEMEQREEELKKDNKSKFWEWFVFKIHGISSNHSQDWLLALFWIISFTFVYSHFKIYGNQTANEYYTILLILSFIGIFFSIVEAYLYKKIEYKFMLFIIIMSFLIYSMGTNDYKLHCFSNNLNPFSIMTGVDDLNLSTLIYKVIIAYLIYQFIVSVRQNTRRK